MVIHVLLLGGALAGLLEESGNQRRMRLKKKERFYEL